ncbi:SAM-dependent methyltransferase [Frankia sp. AiPs1]|uniref:SAM-dependent methyltransferase n=1 Tax=Frankia sp. AiPs1 TaxID=573493 RepID=UPI0020440E59|nr:SAM-dependent methyltransferase [Frankia sp. AiPs1]MCM3922800.1 SAM-dependent methyltransferase [Frankia sp. AiPs1]
MTADASPQQDPGARIDTSVPHSARIWNYWLGGKDSYPVDREAGDEYLKIFPGIAELARASRGFLTRSVTWLAAEAGIRQFLDVGTGLPTADNTHEVAQRAAPDARIVYVDNDPLVLVHARALLVGTPQGATDYLDADLRDPAAVLAGAARTLDLDQPVALMLMGVLGHIADDAEIRRIVDALLAPLVPGSYLVSYDGTLPADGGEFDAAQDEYNDSGAVPYLLRTPEQLARRFDGLELVPPGVVPHTHWRPAPTANGSLPPAVDGYCGVARKS